MKADLCCRQHANE